MMIPQDEETDFQSDRWNCWGHQLGGRPGSFSTTSGVSSENKRVMIKRLSGLRSRLWLSWKNVGILYQEWIWWTVGKEWTWCEWCESVKTPVWKRKWWSDYVEQDLCEFGFSVMTMDVWPVSICSAQHFCPDGLFHLDLDFHRFNWQPLQLKKFFFSWFQ